MRSLPRVVQVVVRYEEFSRWKRNFDDSPKITVDNEKDIVFALFADFLSFRKAVVATNFDADE